jgi:hypothetical protein
MRSRFDLKISLVRGIFLGNYTEPGPLRKALDLSF